jgi:hypothetical protein
MTSTNIAPAEPTLPSGNAHDPREQLLQRILNTPDFLRSPQLARLLLYICRTSFEGNGAHLTEQHIGVAVFGREPDYDSAADTIVRSHALRLRRRLEQYFQKAGQDEPVHLVVPRGGYVPHFVSLPHDTASGEPHPEPSPLVEVTPQPGPPFPHTIPPQGLTLYRRLTLLLALVCVALVLSLLVIWRAARPLAAAHRYHPLWSRMFTDDQPSRIVLGDSGMVLFHATARRYVSLQDYLSGDLTKQLPYVEHVEPDFAKFLAGRRYTSMVDAATAMHLLRLPEASSGRTLVQFSRDMRLNDFKSGNIVIIGAQEAVPWVELFETNMDFVFSIERPDHRAFFLNRQPLPTEQTSYDALTPATHDKVYAVIAFLPNLSGTGNVLILEGLSMPGTEAAADLVTDDERLLPILATIRGKDGTLPHFEMLLESEG